MTQYCISWVAVGVDAAPRAAGVARLPCRRVPEQIGGLAARPVRVPQGYVLAMPCRRAHLLDTLNSQAHDFSMRAQLPVQIGHTGKIGSLHRSRACCTVDNAQWQCQFKTPALKRGKKSDQLLQTRYKWAFSLRKNNARSKIGQALI
ncbi:hypothetical protein [Janthinobacterium lividum]|uniref:hypothetical protein n=1 Tax=Janthinobacterium lividum TaxID=29581 RepID=UPI0014072B8F|nr:hypothetical protein [Janthinobacterium lividum]